MLSDSSIRRARREGLLDVDPWDDDHLQGASYDLHLSQWFRLIQVTKEACIDPKLPQKELTRLVDVGDQPFVLLPTEFVLASTIERLEFSPVIVGVAEGKSSLARLGLMIHTAGFFDPGFRGHATLELSNHTPMPIKLYPGMPIGQMIFHQLDTDSEKPYGGKGRVSKYQDQDSHPVPSQYYRNFPLKPLRRQPRPERSPY